MQDGQMAITPETQQRTWTSVAKNGKCHLETQLHRHKLTADDRSAHSQRSPGGQRSESPASGLLPESLLAIVFSNQWE